MAREKEKNERTTLNEDTTKNTHTHTKMFKINDWMTEWMDGTNGRNEWAKKMDGMNRMDGFNDCAE